MASGTNGDRPHVGVERRGDTVLLSLQACFERDALLRFHETEFWRRARLVMKRSQATFLTDARRQIVLSAQAFTIALLRKVEAVVEALAARPMTPRMVRQVLGITNRERLRWSKDGRLPAAPLVVEKRGQAFTVGLYAARAIRHLVENPSILAEWRRTDARP